MKERKTCRIEVQVIGRKKQNPGQRERSGKSGKKEDAEGGGMRERRKKQRKDVVKYRSGR